MYKLSERYVIAVMNEGRLAHPMAWCIGLVNKPVHFKDDGVHELKKYYSGESTADPHTIHGADIQDLKIQLVYSSDLLLNTNNSAQYE